MARLKYVQGTTKLRRKLRRIDPEITKELRTVVAESALAIQLDAIAGAPVDEGDLVRSIETKISRDGFTAIVGPGVKAAEIMRRKTGSPFATGSEKARISKRNKAALFEFFKGYWIEFGTKGNAKRGIPAQPARPFMAPAYKVNEAWIVGRARKAIRRILKRASRG